MQANQRDDHWRRILFSQASNLAVACSTPHLLHCCFHFNHIQSGCVLFLFVSDFHDAVWLSFCAGKYLQGQGSNLGSRGLVSLRSTIVLDMVDTNSVLPFMVAVVTRHVVI
jgi:hypothetical protein